MKSIHHIFSPLSLPFTSPSHKYPLRPISQSCLLLLTPKSMLKGGSQCFLALNILYFGQCNLSVLLSLTPSLLPPLFNSFQYTSLQPLPAQTWSISILLTIILFSFPSKENSVVPLLPTHSTYRCVYDHAWFCVHIHLWDLFSTYERKHVAFVFLNLTYFI
jgi:hypothetical protein